MNNEVCSITTNLKNELTILQSMARIRISIKNNPTQRNDTVLLDRFSPVVYLEQKPELKSIMEISIHNHQIFNRHNHKQMSNHDLLKRINTIKIV